MLLHSCISASNVVDAACIQHSCSTKEDVVTAHMRWVAGPRLRREVSASFELCAMRALVGLHNTKRMHEAQLTR